MEKNDFLVANRRLTEYIFSYKIEGQIEYKKSFVGNIWHNKIFRFSDEVFMLSILWNKQWALGSSTPFSIHFIRTNNVEGNEGVTNGRKQEVKDFSKELRDVYLCWECSSGFLLSIYEKRRFCIFL